MKTSPAQILYHNFFLLERSKLLDSIRKGFILLIPVFMAGAVALVLRNIPIAAVDNWIHTVWGGKIENVLAFIYEATFGLVALYILIAVSFRYAQSITGEDSGLNVLNCIVSIASYFGLLGTKRLMEWNGGQVQIVMLQYLDVQNVFTALLVAVASTRLFLFLCKRLRPFKKVTVGIELDFKRAVSAIFPLLLTVALFSVCGLMIEVVFHAENFSDLIIRMFSAPFESLGRSFWSAALVVFMESFFWFFGIHGSNVFQSVVTTVFADGQGEIFTKTFLDCFVLVGGCGASVCLLSGLFLFSRSKTNRNLAKNCVFPMVFNINEILVFGLPIVFNPIYFIPFLLTPLAMLVTSYGAIALGIVPLAANTVQWTTPLLFSGYLATGSAAGVFLQLFNIAVGILIYMPFIKLSNKISRKRFEDNVRRLTERMQEAERTGIAPSLLSEERELATAGKELSFALRSALDSGEVELYFQPQMNDGGKMVACEALLRWKAMSDQFVYPPLILDLAQEDGSLGILTDYILEKSFAAAKKLNEKFGTSVSLSVNLQCSQFTNPTFMKSLVERVEKAEILPWTYEIEITEESELSDSENAAEIFKLLREHRILVAIDDFSMGYTSLKYLQNNSFDTVKLDGKMLREVLTNTRTQDIVKSIAKLGESLGFQVTAEYVETEEQKQLLQKLGCKLFQGWLFSPAVPFDELVKFPAEDSESSEKN